MGIGMEARATTLYEVECWRPWLGFRTLTRALRKAPNLSHLERFVPKRLAWADSFHNAVVTEGLNQLLDATLKTGDAAPAWYVGLKDTGAVNAADTLASHAGWSELTNYTGDRQAFTPGTIAAGSVDNSASKASFPITGTDDIYGAFLCDVATGSSGILYGAGDFSAQRGVISGDTLNVTVTASVSAA